MAPRTSYARVYATIQGKPKRYLGLYSIVENVDDTFVASHYGVPGGTLFKPVTTRLFNDLGRDWSKYNQSYDPKTTLTDADKQRIFDLSDLVTHSSDEVFAAKLPQFVDLDLFAWRRNRSRGAPISSGRPSPALVPAPVLRRNDDADQAVRSCPPGVSAEAVAGAGWILNFI